MKILVAVPTIRDRADRCAESVARWRASVPDVIVDVSRAPGGWCAGLNEVWRRHRDADVFVCASDDMVPENDGWLAAVLEPLRQGLYPAPCVIDPRWTNYGGHDVPVPDGTPSSRSTFPILRGDWLDLVFPLPPDLHYYGDDLILARLSLAGVRCVAVPSARILHLCDARGRGAGAGSEAARMEIDVARFERELERLRERCPPVTPPEASMRRRRALITFIVATVGRPSLARALTSLLDQQDGAWRAIVVGDGVEPHVPADRRVRVLAVGKLGHPGLVRNTAIPHVRTPWAGFLDDDDRLAPDYVHRLRAAQRGADVVVFRMLHPQLGMLPLDDAVRHGNVGISFAVRTAMLRDTPFRADFLYSNEDYELIHDLEQRGARIRFSPHCCYLVRDA